MLIVDSCRVAVRVVCRQYTVEISLKAFTGRKIEGVTLAHLIGCINRTHIRLGYDLRYVEDGIGIVKSGHMINRQVRLEGVIGVNVGIVYRHLPAPGKLPAD